MCLHRKVSACIHTDRSPRVSTSTGFTCIYSERINVSSLYISTGGERRSIWLWTLIWMYLQRRSKCIYSVDPNVSTGGDRRSVLLPVTLNVDPHVSTAQIRMSLQGATVDPYDFEHWSECIYSIDPYVSTGGEGRSVWISTLIRMYLQRRSVCTHRGRP